MNSYRNYKVMVSGATGSIGRSLSLILKQNSLITQLALYDIVRVAGVVADLSHMDTKTLITGYEGPKEMCGAVKDADIIVCTAGSPRKPGMSRDDLFSINATIVYQLAEAMAQFAPNAALAIVTNPVNSLVPIAANVLWQAGVFNPCKVFGVTTLDLVRASAFIGAINCIDPACVKCPVIGGHASTTIIPVLSQSNPPVNLSASADIEALTKRIQEAGTEVVKAKAGEGSASLSTAYAVARFTDSILKGFSGQCGIIECAYVRSDVAPVKYFANPLQLGRNGVEMNYGYGCLNSYERSLFCEAIPQLEKSIKKGDEWKPSSKGASCK